MTYLTYEIKIACRLTSMLFWLSDPDPDPEAEALLLALLWVGAPPAGDSSIVSSRLLCLNSITPCHLICTSPLSLTWCLSCWMPGCPRCPRWGCSAPRCRRHSPRPRVLGQTLLGVHCTDSIQREVTQPVLFHFEKLYSLQTCLQLVKIDTSWIIHRLLNI